MSRRTRNALFGAGLVLAAGLGTGLVAYYRAAPQATGMAELDYLPSDVTAVAFADVRSIMDSEVRERLRQGLPAGAERERLQTELGIDIEHDVDTVVAGIVGSPAERRGIILLRGRFDEALLSAAATEHGATAEEYQGRRLWLAAADEGDGVDGAMADGPPGFAFLEPDLVAIGTPSAIRRAIDTLASRAAVTRDAALMALVSEVRVGHDAWIVGRVDAEATSSLPEAVRAPLSAVEWFSAGAEVGLGVTGRLRTESRDDASAAELRDVIQGGLATARLMSGQDERVKSVVNALQVGGSGRTVSVVFAITPELLDAMSELSGLQPR